MERHRRPNPNLIYKPLMARYGQGVFNQIIAALMLGEGVVSGLIGWVLYRKKKAKLALCHRTWGDVIEVREHTGRRGGRTHHPVVRFKGMNGQDVAFESNYGSSTWKVKAGDRLEVLFNPSNPKDAEVAGFMVQWFLPLVLAIISAASIIGAPLLYLILKR